MDPLTRPITEDHLQAVPLFPLPHAAFFPHTMLPLHVFEPRYRAMTAWCLEHDWPMAVVAIRPGHESEQRGEPPLTLVGGVGHIVHHEKLDDGRFHILLHGRARVQLHEILSDRTHPWRSAEAELLPDQGSVGAADMIAVRACLRALAQKWPKGAPLLSKLLEHATEPAALANGAGAFLLPDHDARQAHLEEQDVGARIDTVLARVSEMLVQLEEGGLH